MSNVNAISATDATPKNMQIMNIVCSITIPSSLLLPGSYLPDAGRRHVGRGRVQVSRYLCRSVS
jgi:hypothetical protein